MPKMKLCKSCSKEIAKSSKVCPYCGATLKMGTTKKIIIILAIFAILAVIVSVISPNYWSI